MHKNILFKGHLSAADIIIQDHPESFFVPHVPPQKIDQLWDEFLVNAAIAKKKVWDAPLYRMQEFNYRDSLLYLQLSTIYAREVAVLRSFLKEFEVGTDNELLKNIFVASLIKTTDDQYLFGLKSGVSVGNSRVDLIGGVLSRAEIKVTSGHDIVLALYNEFAEEANIHKNNILSSSLRGILLSPMLSIGMIWFTELKISSQKAVELFNIENDGELSELCFIPCAKLKDFLQKQGSYLPWLVDLL